MFARCTHTGCHTCYRLGSGLLNNVPAAFVDTTCQSAGWNVNPEDAAAFAAAQQMQAAEAAREAQRAPANEQPNLHQD